MSQPWREGARTHDPRDVCPACGVASCEFAWDFRKFGKHAQRVCLKCMSVSVDGEKAGEIKEAGGQANA